MLNRGKKILKDESGSLAVDFTFGLSLAFISMGIFFAMTFTLSMISLSQYVAYASSRTYYAGHLTPDLQQNRAYQKYATMLNTEPFKTLLNAQGSGWFELKFVSAGVSPSFQPQDSLGRDIFEGTTLNFTADILDMSFPFIGGSTDGPFTTQVHSFLGREPSTSECIENYVKQKISMMESKGYSFGAGSVSIGAWPDNGC